MGIDYEFTADHDWCGPFRKNSSRRLLQFKDKPFKYLEVGVYEGRSLTWLAENVLTHKDSFAVGVDIWLNKDIRQRAFNNIAYHQDHLGVLQGTLADCVGSFKSGSFDCIYIDGDHTYLPVLTDTVLAWPLLKAGGLMAWDDTEWDDPRYQVKDAITWLLEHLPHKRLKAENQIWIQKL